MIFDGIQSGMTPEEIEPLPVDAILETLVSEYPDLNLIRENQSSVQAEAADDGHFIIQWGTHYFRFEFSGDAESEMNHIVSIMSRFNLPCYDASEFKLYAASNPPEFRPGMKTMGSPIQPRSVNSDDETLPDAEMRTPNWEKRIADLVDPTKEKQSKIESNNALLKSLLAAQVKNRPDSDADAPPWKRVGLDDDDLADVCKNLNEHAASESPVPPEQSDEMELWVSSTVSVCLTVMAINQAGYPGLAPPLDDNRIAAERIAAAGMAYFFGAWRLNTACISQLYKGEPIRHALPWMDNLRATLAACAALNRWESFDQLATWPDADLCFDEGTDNSSLGENACQIWLAMKLRAAADHQIQEQRSIIERSRKARPRKLLSIADAVFSGDATATTKGMQAFLVCHRESIRNHHRLDLWLSLDMTVLWHLAKRRGMSDLELPEDLMPHIIRL